MRGDFDHPPFLDNLIPLKTDLRQTQTAGWTPGAAVHAGLGCIVHANQMIPVADSVSLSADIYTPGLAGRHPTVLAFAAYSHQLQTTAAPTATNECGEPPLFTNRGYNHVVVSRRGMGRSGGDSTVFFNDTDVEDHLAVIAWCARQPWCDGNVVLFGTSYYAVVQLLVAVRQPPALKAFFGSGTDTDYFRQIAMFGGAPQVDFLTIWMGANFTGFQEKLRLAPVWRAAISWLFNSPLKHLWVPLVQRLMPRIQRRFRKFTPELKYRRLLAEWIFDGKTRATHSIPEGPRADLGRINMPFVVVQDTGYFNLHQFGSYELIEKAGTPSGRKWLIMAPPGYALPVYGWQIEALAFFDHIVHGADNGYAAQPPVRYQVAGGAEGEYLGAEAFPIPGSRTIRLFPVSSGSDNAIHTLADAPVAGRNSWVAVPYGAIVPPKLDEAANPVLTFEARITDTVLYAGPVTLSLRFSCSDIDSHVIARLGRVDTAGSIHPLSMGSIRPALRRIDRLRSTATEIAIDMDRPEPLVPGEPVTLLFSLTPRPVRLRAGERLRLDVASRTDLLRSDVSHGYAHFDMIVPPYFSRNTIHFGPDTFLELAMLDAPPASSG